MQLELLIPIVIILALLISAMGSLSGVGGGVLYVPLLLWMLPNKDFNEIKFVSTLLVFGSAFVNVTIEMLKKRFSPILFMTIIGASLPTIFLGTYLAKLTNLFISQLIVVIFLSIVVILLSFNPLINKAVLQYKQNHGQLQVTKTHWYVLKTKYALNINLFKLVVITFLAGLITTFTGMGGGTIIMPLLLLTCGLTIKQSTPISHSIILISTIVTLGFNYAYFTNSELNLTLSLPMLMGVVVGSSVAAIFKGKIKKDWIIKWLLISLIIISIIKMIIDLVNFY